MDNKNPINELKQSEKNKSGRWVSIFQWTDLIGTLRSLIAGVIVSFSISVVRDLFPKQLSLSEIPTLLVIAISIVFGVLTILYSALYFYKRRTAAKRTAIIEMQKIEQFFFSKVDVEISALLSEKVNYGESAN